MILVYVNFLCNQKKISQTIVVLFFFNYVSIMAMYSFLTNFSTQENQNNTFYPKTIVPETEVCPFCKKNGLKLQPKSLKFLHTALGTFKVSVQYKWCYKIISNNNNQKTRCHTVVRFNNYTNNNQQYLLTTVKPKYILVGQNHLFEVFYLQQFVVSQLLHGNGVHLLAQETRIACKHESTPPLTSILQGSKKISPAISNQTLAQGIKWFMVLKFLNNSLDQTPPYFPGSASIEEIIELLYPSLMSRGLNSHHTSTYYRCNQKVFVLDGTVKVTFRVCGFLGCFRKPVGVNSTMCKLHKHREPDKLEKAYTGGIYNMLCECGCPVGLEVYKGGESHIDMLAFA